MTPFYYVRTPRNIYGESLVHPVNNVSYEVYATHTSSVVHFKSKDSREVDGEVERLSHILATKMAYAMHI